MEIKNFIKEYRQSYSKYDMKFNCNQLMFLRHNSIYEIILSEKKEFFNIYFYYKNIKCALFFRELKEDNYVFEFKDYGDPDYSFSHKIEIKKDSKFNAIEKAIESAVLKICFNDLRF